MGMRSRNWLDIFLPNTEHFLMLYELTEKWKTLAARFEEMRGYL